MMTKPALKREGRPRSTTSRQSTLDATLRLLRTCSVRDLTIEAISKEAGVGKPTIYRWWPSKAAVVVDAFFDSISFKLTYSTSGPIKEAIKAHMRLVMQIVRGDHGRLIAEIIAEGHFDRHVLESFEERFLKLRRDAALEIVAKGKTTGEIHADVDEGVAVDLIFSPMYSRLMLGRELYDDERSDYTIDLIFGGLMGRPESADRPT